MFYEQPDLKSTLDEEKGREGGGFFMHLCKFILCFPLGTWRICALFIFVSSFCLDVEKFAKTRGSGQFRHGKCTLEIDTVE